LQDEKKREREKRREGKRREEKRREEVSHIPASEIAAFFVLHTNSISTTVSKTRTPCFFTAVDTLESWVTLASVA